MALVFPAARLRRHDGLHNGYRLEPADAVGLHAETGAWRIPGHRFFIDGENKSGTFFVRGYLGFPLCKGVLPAFSDAAARSQ
jgi:hypothetical protein